MRLFLFLVIGLSLTGFRAAQAAECAQAPGHTDTPQLHTAQANPLTLNFDSGAQWQLCWHVDDHSGLVLSRVYFAGPENPLRKVLDALSVAQVMYQFDEDTQASHLLSEFGLGGEHWNEQASFCQNGEWIIGEHQQICQHRREINLLTRARHYESLPRNEVALQGLSTIGSKQFQQVWRLTEDGEIKPSVVYSGKLSRFTNNPNYGVQVDNSGSFASTATILVSWRLDFNIDNSPNNDRIDEFNFVASSLDSLTREIDITPITTEAFRLSKNTDFRGWRISDKEASSGENGADSPTRIGYYLDPQPSGFRLINHSHRWAEFDITLTNRQACEKLASGNTEFSQSCGANLDDYVNEEAIDDAVMWFSLTRHFTPSTEDANAIRANHFEFSLIPFDWSATSPFSAMAERVDASAGDSE